MVCIASHRFHTIQPVETKGIQVGFKRKKKKVEMAGKGGGKRKK